MPQFSSSQSLNLGTARVTFLADGGGIVNPLALFAASSEEEWQSHADLLDTSGRFVTSIGGFLIELGERTLLIDAGIGPQTMDFPGFGPFKGGDFMNSLAGTGVRPEEVTDLIFTHLHLDHCGWISHEVDDERRLLFPNARYHVTAKEWDFWYGGDQPAGPDPERVQKPLAERIEFFREGDELAPGLVALETPGHTPGHASLALTSDGERLLLLGDLIHTPAQLQERHWVLAFDADGEKARQSRERLLEVAEKDQYLIAAGHFSNQVFGRLDQLRGQRFWVPLARE